MKIGTRARAVETHGRGRFSVYLFKKVLLRIDTPRYSSTKTAVYTAVPLCTLEYWNLDI